MEEEEEQQQQEWGSTHLTKSAMEVRVTWSWVCVLVMSRIASGMACRGIAHCSGKSPRSPTARAGRPGVGCPCPWVGDGERPQRVGSPVSAGSAIRPAAGAVSAHNLDL